MTDDGENDERRTERRETTLGLLARLLAESLPPDHPVPLALPLATRIAKIEEDLEEAQYIARWLWQRYPEGAKHALGDMGEWPWLDDPPEPTTRAELVEFLVERGVRRDRAERWVDTPAALLSGGVASELIAQPGPLRSRAVHAARRHARYTDPGYWS